MKSILKTTATSLILAALFAGNAYADSDYGLVVKATNKLIDDVEFLKSDGKIYSDGIKERKAVEDNLQKQIDAITKTITEKDGAVSLKLQHFETSIKNESNTNADDAKVAKLEAEVVALQSNVDRLSAMVEKLSAPKGEKSFDDEAEQVKQQRARLQKFIEQDDKDIQAK